MTPEIHEMYGTLKLLSNSMAPALELWERQRKEFEEKARVFADGTLDAVLPHSMSITDMRRSQDNLNKALKVSRLMGELRNLLVISEEKTDG